LLQHGSIILARSPFAPELPGLLEAATLPSEITFEEFVARWQPLISKTLQLELAPGELSADEELAARRWQEARFATDEWNFKR
jgi:hypothetical protein